MKIYGPYTRRDGRSIIIFKHDDGRQQTKSYPKWLLEQRLGRELLNDETADHIDEDKTNNDILNLQVLTRSENAKKNRKLFPRQIYSFVCPVCGKTAEKFLNHVRGNWKKGRKGPYCSRRCAGTANN